MYSVRHLQETCDLLLGKQSDSIAHYFFDCQQDLKGGEKFCCLLSVIVQMFGPGL